MSEQNNGDQIDSVLFYRLPSGRQLDCRKWKPIYYVIDVDFDERVSNISRMGSVAIYSNGFIWVQTACVLKEYSALEQDNNYFVLLSDNNRKYQNVAARPDLLWGNPNTGRIAPSQVETWLEGSTVVTAQVTNNANRGIEQPFPSVQLCLHGYEPWKAND